MAPDDAIYKYLEPEREENASAVPNPGRFIGTHFSIPHIVTS